MPFKRVCSNLSTYLLKLLVMNDLAIIIPAYKIDFFDKTLDSLARQTCKNFNVYIGDDNSPYDFESLIAKYTDLISIKYVKFETNLGSKNLVKQWERCISLTENESWLWLFSDDDVIGSRCVELFYDEIKNKKYDIYHFDVKIINHNDVLLRVPYGYNSIYTSRQLYLAKCSSKIESFVVENIFSKAIYQKVNGFQEFDLAWGSDTATWVKMSQYTGIKTIKGDYIYWRQSNLNITPQKNKDMSIRKLLANVEFFHWSNTFWGNEWKMRSKNVFFFTKRVLYYLPFLPFNKIKEVLDLAKQYNILNNFQSYILMCLCRIEKINKKDVNY